MGVFSRFMDIINSNINSLLDQAENPEKMVKLMINEMEDTIIEIKTNCAAAIGAENTAKRKVQELEGLVDRWQKRAELAISKGRDDLAREALLEKKKLTAELEKLRAESERYDQLVKKYKADIEKLNEKLESAKAKYRAMREQAAREAEEAEARRKASSGPYTYTYNWSSKNKDADPVERFSRMEEHIDKMSERKNQAAEDKDTELKFKDLEEQEEIESELEQLKKNMNG
ncbi:MAG: PspA/IM30 family protein [Spirochaetales bacterium]|nr:PspA/IM30 family protein [Spirochaetales bacterium]